MKVSAIAVGVIAALGLTGCQAIPDSGPVNPGLTDLQQSEQQVLFAPSGPVAGATQEDIVRGFASAASSSTSDYAIARQFLTPGYAQQWDPYSEVLVDEGSRTFISSGERVGELSVPAVASVSANGEFSPLPPGPKTSVRYEFEKVGEEWRISSAPTGIILDRATFTTAWSPHEIYFLGSDDGLVPETRWFLSRTSTATQIVKELLAGPTEQMRDVLRSGFPAETALTSTSVPVVDGTARVDLSGELLGVDESGLERMTKQLAASLQAVAGVSNLELFSEGALIAEAPVGRSEDSVTGSETKDAAVLRDGEFGVYAAGELEGLGELGDAIVDLDPDGVTLAASGTEAVVQNKDGINWVSEGDVLKLEGGPKTLEPSLDPFGYVWTYSTGVPDQLIAILPGSVLVKVAAPWLSGQRPVAVRVSPDGSRVAALVSTGDGKSSLVTAGILRDDDDVPTKTTDGAKPQLWIDGGPVDFDWIDQVKFATLTDVGESSKVTVGVSGSFAVDAGSVPNGASLSGSGSRSTLRVLDASGDLFAPQGSGWQKQTDDVDLLAKRG